MWLKKRFLRFLFVCLLVCCMTCLKNTCSMAYTWEDIDDFNTQLLNNSDVNQTTKNYINLYNTRKQSFKNYFINNNMNIEDWAGVTFLGSSTNTLYMQLQRSTTVITKSSTILMATHCYTIWLKRDGSVTNNGTDFTITMWANTDPYDYWGLTNGSYTGIYENNQYFDNYYTPPPSVTFSPYSDGNISVSYNGTSDSFLKFNISRSVPQWALGKLDGLSGDMRLDVKLNRYMNSEFTTLVGHAQWYGGQRTSSGGLSIATDGVVYIDNTMLYYNQGYYLTIDLEGENVDNYPLYFLPYASTATSGDLLSPLIDTNSDLEILQNLQELVNIQNIGTIYDENFGNSGELLGNLDYNDYHDNYYYAYFSDIFEELHSTLLSSGDRSISFGFMGTTINLNSSDFTTPNNAIKLFCNTFLTFALFMYLYKSCFHMFHKLQEGNLIGAMHTMTVDDESVYM